MNTDLQTSKRFQPVKTRRDFLGLASLWSAGVALLIGLLGALRLPVPAVFPESNSRSQAWPAAKFRGDQSHLVSRIPIVGLFGRGGTARHFGDLHAFGLHGRDAGGRRVLLPLPWEPIRPVGCGRCGAGATAAGPPRTVRLSGWATGGGSAEGSKLGGAFEGLIRLSATGCTRRTTRGT